MNNSVTFILFVFVLTVWTCSDQSEEKLSKAPSKSDSAVVYKIRSGAYNTELSSHHTLKIPDLELKARLDSSAIFPPRLTADPKAHSR